MSAPRVPPAAIKTKTWGNPIWGNINGDGNLDLIVPKHELSAHGPRGNGPPPFVYLNNAMALLLTTEPPQGFTWRIRIPELGSASLLEITMETAIWIS